MFELVVGAVILAAAVAGGLALRSWWLREWASRSRWELWADRFASWRGYLFPPAPMTPRKLQRYVAKRALSQTAITLGGGGHVPETVVVRINPEDTDLLPADIVARLEVELATWLRRQADRRGWELSAKPVVVFHPDPAAPAGRPRVKVSFDVATRSEVGEERVRSDGTPPTQLLARGVLEEVDSGSTLELGDGQSVMVGRSSTCPVRIDDPRVSRRHATLWADDAGWCVRADPRATNGVYVNGRRITATTRLFDGDVIGFGNSVRYRFSLAPDRTRSEATPESDTA